MAERERGSSAFCRHRSLLCAGPLIAPVLPVARVLPPRVYRRGSTDRQEQQIAPLVGSQRKVEHDPPDEGDPDQEVVSQKGPHGCRLSVWNDATRRETWIKVELFDRDRSARSLKLTLFPAVVTLLSLLDYAILHQPSHASYSGDPGGARSRFGEFITKSTHATRQAPAIHGINPFIIASLGNSVDVKLWHSEVPQSPGRHRFRKPARIACFRRVDLIASEMLDGRVFSGAKAFSSMITSDLGPPLRSARTSARTLP
jgi:hypothetical protein